jgi:hypothetical protein
MVNNDGPNIVEFEDPPGVVGNFSASGGPYPANGVVVWYPSTTSGNYPYEADAECTLPASEHASCTAILNDFLDRYGTPP